MRIKKEVHIMKFSNKVINMVKLHMLIVKDEKFLKSFSSEDRQNLMLILSFIYTAKETGRKISSIFLFSNRI